MELIGRGREADVFAVDQRRVLRRTRDGRDAEPEARLLRHLAGHGYPVPEVYDVDGADLVMERLSGPNMSEVARSQPWRARGLGATLGRLHRSLHAVPAPAWLPPATADDDRPCVVHLDLHPDNVLLTPRGPVVIDWANSAAGTAALDVAMTLVILLGIELRAHERLLIRVLLSAMRRACGTDPRPALPAAVTRRLADPNLTPHEAALVTRLGRRYG
ncbi:phosphotransferase [Actinacidiphila acidipaludis]|uniref:Aminoglycoside phosphotransferase family protein n=1 Tax=Actinacidiphila acidipaludis TaxID=2873382 RepID=A0ABS7QE28_9ACTN|nr:aminoglycoside phosphotransferase family protein [Streptomyces acidipaludis]MBY8881420.1 aminoglycoside phosphotransferase family protein [Streptomyces acidipaludis]